MYRLSLTNRDEFIIEQKKGIDHELSNKRIRSIKSERHISKYYFSK